MGGLTVALRPMVLEASDEGEGFVMNCSSTQAPIESEEGARAASMTRARLPRTYLIAFYLAPTGMSQRLSLPKGSRLEERQLADRPHL